MGLEGKSLSPWDGSASFCLPSLHSLLAGCRCSSWVLSARPRPARGAVTGRAKSLVGCCALMLVEPQLPGSWDWDVALPSLPQQHLAA